MLCQANQTPLRGDGDGFGSVAGAEFGEDGGDVKFDGAFGDFKGVGDLFVEEALGDEGEDLELAGGECIGVVAAAVDVFEQARGDDGLEQ